MVITNSFAQRNYDAYYRGENKEVINRVDSLSYKRSHFFSDFHVDSSTQKPYTGLMTVKYNINSPVTDSVCLVNGLEHGYKKSYKINKKSKNQVLCHLIYTNQHTKTQILLKLEKNKNYSGVINTRDYKYFFEPKKGGIRLVKYQTISSNKREKILRITLSNAKVFQSYILTEDNRLYEICKEMGLFDEELVIPILKGNCNE